jgi:hypothetical protein
METSGNRFGWKLAASKLEVNNAAGTSVSANSQERPAEDIFLKEEPN